MDLAHLPAVRAAADPHGPAVADDQLDLDNAAFDDAVSRATATLRGHGVGAGDVVAIMLPNTALLVVTLFAAWRLGAAATPINPWLTPAESDYQVRDAAASVVVTDPPAADAPAPGHTATVVPVGSLLDAEPDPAPPFSPAADDLALLIYTSGSTGRPKGVLTDHANLDAMCGMLIATCGTTSADRSLLILPLFHANGIVVGTLTPLLAGGSVVIAGRFTPATFFDRLESSGATYFSAVPTILTLLADLPADVQPDTSAVRYAGCGAAPASVELLERFEKRFGIPVIEGYGLSETTCVATLNPLDGVRKPGTVGLPLEGISIRVTDGDGRDAPVGEPGEVLISGPNVMRGYLGRPEATAETLVDGWLRTGDIGLLDEDGYLRLVDRAKDMIIRGGENIYPKEIETVVYQIPGIAAAAVVGRPSDLYGEVPVLYVSAAPGAELDTAAIAAHAAESLAKYKLPVDITVLDALPTNAVGKIDKPTLRARTASAR
ncbi:class I adenylate-forming enzyme family protein [Tsukamurella soli]|uniref:Long-chain fatty acid--CoA ligase n=1 Tax=Tsukamurella soli TaxID=644556 RepID=A0ABP8JW86_9ACTN